MNSRLYVGQVRHRRHTPVSHAFQYGMFMLYLDLDELPTVFSKRWFWSISRPALARFRREDHLGETSVGLADEVRRLVKEQANISLTGPIRLLTNLRYFGYGFNPVSFYYCFNAADDKLEAIVAEVNAIRRLRNAASRICSFRNSSPYQRVENPPQIVARRESLNE